MPSFSPLRLRVSATTWQGRLALSKGSPGRICQWSKTHWGKAWPPVLDLKSAVKPGRDKRKGEVRREWSQFDVTSMERPEEPMRQPLNYPKGELSHLDYFHRRSLSAERLLLFCRELLTRPQVCVVSDQGINRKVSKNFNA